MAVQDTRVVRNVERLSQRLKTIRAALSVPLLTKEIGNLLLRRTLVRFEDEEDPQGRPWAPLKDSTLARRKREGGRPGKKILQQTEGLKRAIRIIRSTGAEGAIYTNTGALVRIGVEDGPHIEKARTHQRGLRARNIPARRFLGVAYKDVAAADALLRRASRRAGFG